MAMPARASEQTFAYLDKDGIQVTIKGVKRLVPNTGKVTSYCWDRDGIHLIAVRGKNSLERIALDGSSKVLLRTRGEARFPDVCERDGSISFSHKVEKASWRIQILGPYDEQPRDLTSGYDSCFSPDGSKIFFEDFSPQANIYVIDRRSLKRKKLLDDQSARHTVSVSPNGERLLFSEKQRLVSYNLLTGVIREMTAEGAYDRFASLSANGNAIIFFREADGVASLIEKNLTTGQEKTLLAKRAVLPIFAPLLPTLLTSDRELLLKRSKDNLSKSSWEKLSGLSFTHNPMRWRKLNNKMQDNEQRGKLALFLHGLKELSPAMAAQLSKVGRGKMIFLPDLKTLSLPAARLLLRDHAPYELYLDGLQEVSLQLAQQLASLEANHLSLGGIKRISPRVAEELSNFKATLALNGLKSIDIATARSLSKWVGNGERYFLMLDGLSSLETEVARELAKLSGWGISLGGLKGISPELLEGLAAYDGACLRLNSVEQLNEEVARKIASTWSIKFLELNSIGEVDAEVQRIFDEARKMIFKWMK